MNLQTRVKKLEQGTGEGKPQVILLWLWLDPALSEEARGQKLADAEAEHAGTNNTLLIFTGDIDPNIELV